MNGLMGARDRMLGLTNQWSQFTEDGDVEGIIYVGRIKPPPCQKLYQIMASQARWATLPV
jgi:hypothetical protein